MSQNERKDNSGKIKEVPLGLSDSENQALAECRRQIVEKKDPALDDLRDATLARFLRHNSWVVEPAIKQMKEYLTWRKENNIDHILDNPDFPSKELIRTIVPYAYHGFDKEGRPIYLEKTGQLATAALADSKLYSFDHFMHSHIYGVEYMQRKMYESSLARGERVNGITTILDFNGLGFHHLSCTDKLKKCLDFDKQYYPEYLGKLYVINAPFGWVADLLFKSVKMFLDPVIQSRIQIVPGDPSAFLLENISPDNLPVEYGGSCTGEKCQHGGMGNVLDLKGCADVLDASGLKPAEIPDLETLELTNGYGDNFAAEKIICAEGNQDRFTWYFEVVDGYTIDFSVEELGTDGKPKAEESHKRYVKGGEKQTVTTATGSWKAPYPNAKVAFRWDNYSSYINAKTIKYIVKCISDEPAGLDALVAAAAAPAASPASSSQ